MTPYKLSWRLLLLVLTCSHVIEARQLLQMRKRGRPPPPPPSLAGAGDQIFTYLDSMGNTHTYLFAAAKKNFLDAMQHCFQYPGGRLAPTWAAELVTPLLSPGLSFLQANGLYPNNIWLGVMDIADDFENGISTYFCPSLTYNSSHPNGYFEYMDCTSLPARPFVCEIAGQHQEEYRDEALGETTVLTYVIAPLSANDAIKYCSSRLGSMHEAPDPTTPLAEFVIAQGLEFLKSYKQMYNTLWLGKRGKKGSCTMVTYDFQKMQSTVLTPEDCVSPRPFVCRKTVITRR